MAGRKVITSSRSMSVATVVAIVFVASAFVILRSMPEQVTAVSQDGLVHATGLTRSSGSLMIERIDNIETIEQALSPVYEVSLTGNGRIDDGELVMTIKDTDALSDIVLFTFDRETLSWIALPTLFDLSQKTLSTSLDLSGSLLIVAGERE